MSSIMGWRLFCVLGACLVLCGASSDSKKYLDGPGLHNVLEKQRDRSANTEYNVDDPLDMFSHRNVFEIVSDLIKGHENAVKEALRPVFRKMNQEHALDEIIDGLMHAQAEPEPDSTLCTTCRLVTTAVKFGGGSGLISWDDLFPPLNWICINIVPLTLYPNLDVEYFCPRAIQLQGPHVFNAVTELVPVIEPRRHCEFFNVCFPEGIPVTVPNPLPFTLPFTLPNLPGFPGMKARRGRRQTARRSDLSTAIKIAHISDIHVEEAYAVGSKTRDCGLYVCCLEQYGPGEAGEWGDYNCNTPSKTVDLVLQKVAELAPDFIIYTGDNAPHTFWDETEWSQWNCTRHVIDAFQRNLPGKPVYPVIGNHEMFPTNIWYQDYQPTQDMNKHFMEWWHGLAGFTSDNNDTMQLGTFYTKQLRPGLQLVALNTELLYAYNWYNGLIDAQADGPFNPNPMRRQEQMLQEVLSKARTDGDKVIILGHHPPATRDSIIELSRKQTALRVEYSDVIVLHAAGHTHTDEFRLYKDTVTGDAEGMVYVAPSVSPGGTKNPAFKIFYMDAVTFEVLDYDHHFLDLRKVVESQTPEVEFMYRATEEYGLSDLSPASWQEFVQRMSEDYSLFMTYNTNRFSRSPSGDSCNPNSCRQQRLCILSNSNYDEYRHCINNPQYTTPTTTTMSPTTTATTPGTAGAGRRAASLVFITLVTVISSLTV